MQDKFSKYKRNVESR